MYTGKKHNDECMCVYTQCIEVERSKNKNWKT